MKRLTVIFFACALLMGAGLVSAQQQDFSKVEVQARR